jgi:hypothetical protein
MTSDSMKSDWETNGEEGTRDEEGTHDEQATTVGLVKICNFASLRPLQSLYDPLQSCEK